MKKITPLTDKEKEYLSNELLNRLKDIFYMQSERRVADVIEKFSDLNFYEGDSFSFTYEVSMKAADILQIIGRKRRLLEMPTPRETRMT
jgi:hypothetical protein